MIIRETPPSHNMTTKELISRIASRTSLPRKEVEQLMQAAGNTMMTALQEGRNVQLQNFGTLEVKDRQPRQIVNPKTGEKSRTKAKRIISFRPNRQLKTQLKTPSNPLT